jgi:hypothetical protein
MTFRKQRAITKLSKQGNRVILILHPSLLLFALKWGAGLIGSGSVIVSQYLQNKENKKQGK